MRVYYENIPTPLHEFSHSFTKSYFGILKSQDIDNLAAFLQK